jgi:hypothetical protein
MTAAWTAHRDIDTALIAPRPLLCGCAHSAGHVRAARPARRAERATRTAPALARPEAALAATDGVASASAAAGAGRQGLPHGSAARAAGDAEAAAPGVQGYSPPPPRVSPIRGLIDFHTHAAPDIFGRAVDDDELAALAATRSVGPAGSRPDGVRSPRGHSARIRS